MLRCLIFILMSFAFHSCNNQEVETPSTDTKLKTDVSNPGNSDPSIAGCYLRALNRDTLAAYLEQNGKRITGKLSFDNYEKDGSTGTVEGMIENGVVKLIYRFQSEGMNSISEIYFKIAADKLVHGFGEIKVKGDSAYFLNPANISYADTLLQIACSALAEKYR